MKLAIFNGSPRRKTSNSKILIEKFLEGYVSGNDNTYSISYLGNTKDNVKHVEKFRDSENVVIIFPLYTDSMPGIVKYFIEIVDTEKYTGKKLGFIVHSGFPESKHSTYIEKYLKKLCKRLDCQYTGTIIKGGSEGLQVKPPNMSKKLFRQFFRLGEIYGQEQRFDKNIMIKLAKPYAISKLGLLLFKLLGKTGLQNFYWNMKLKEHNAYDKRFDTPYK